MRTVDTQQPLIQPPIPVIAQSRHIRAERGAAWHSVNDATTGILIVPKRFRKCVAELPVHAVGETFRQEGLE